MTSCWTLSAPSARSAPSASLFEWRNEAYTDAKSSECPCFGRQPTSIEGMHALTLLAGRDAYALIRERGLRAEDIDVVPGASGGAKWLAIAGLDRYLFGELLQQPRTRPMHLIGSSIGSWRMA